MAVYTHTDKDHIHNHIVINSINLETGKKYQSNKQQRELVKLQNDEICRKNGLSVPERDTAKLRYTQAESALLDKGKTSWKDELRENIEQAKAHTSNFKDFSEHLEQKGISFKVRGKNVSYKPENVNKWVRGKTLGQDYDKGALKYEFESKEREREHDTVRAYADNIKINWDAVKQHTEQLRQQRIRRDEKSKQARLGIHSRSETTTSAREQREREDTQRHEKRNKGLSR
ncbi:RLX protein [Staphylococcus aureus]|nr:RLX protein [Staphylococcus aureus]